ncbi:hypothetical protein PoB_003582700 [Plakobranchus ocellatus]|uniref:Uncharacterized protein n=1 Tax=Plakobranchus ocellatus TaxID=259542 RepID=A0AAV4APV1_9GAST|nr:hypothetical protein PoB_003582700 [Plakobranchus ocellatus]
MWPRHTLGLDYLCDSLIPDRFSPYSGLPSPPSLRAQYPPPLATIPPRLLPATADHSLSPILPLGPGSHESPEHRLWSAKD